MNNTLMALPPPSMEEVMQRITNNKPINKEGLKNPRMIQLQELNVVEVSLGLSAGVPYAVINKKGSELLELFSLSSRISVKQFPRGTTIYELNRLLDYGKVVCWYSTVRDYIDRSNRVNTLYVPEGG